MVSSSYITVNPVVLSDLPPMLILHFDEGTGTTAYDASTNRNDGTISGAAWTTGYSNSALYFHGSPADCVLVPHSASLRHHQHLLGGSLDQSPGMANYLGIVDKFSGSIGNGFTLYRQRRAAPALDLFRSERKLRPVGRA